MTEPSHDIRKARVAIVGGGYTGASAAVLLARRSPVPLEITVIEPRDTLGTGLAYSAPDPDHRLNGTPASHWVDPLDTGAFQRWCDEHRILAQDPGSRAPDGLVYPRRADFGRFVGDLVRAASPTPVGTTIRHLRARAIDAAPRDRGFAVATDGGATVVADALIVATGNPPARLPPPLARVVSHRLVVADPLEQGRVASLPRDARVLVLGSGLTALDVVTTLVRGGHRGPVEVVSRHGLVPRPQRPLAPGATSQPPLLERITGEVAPYIRAVGEPPTVRALLRAMRRQIVEVERRGETWHAAFDDVRDMVGRIWPPMALAEKRRFLRQLRSWYDPHRFRAPPQTGAIVDEARRQGRVRLRAARLVDARCGDDAGPIEVRLRLRGEPRETVETYDAIVNCTGLDADAALPLNPVLASLARHGCIVRDPTGIGFTVDGDCRAIDADGRPQRRLWIVGPPTLGSRGDPSGTSFIGVQLARALPLVLAELAPGGR